MDDHIEERLHKELSEKLTDYRNLTDIQLMEIIDHCVLEEAKKMYLPLKKRSNFEWHYLTRFEGWIFCRN